MTVSYARNRCLCGARPVKQLPVKLGEYFGRSGVKPKDAIPLCAGCWALEQEQAASMGGDDIRPAQHKLVRSWR